MSTPAVVLSAISQVTKQIKLTSATKVLNITDPVRLFEDFVTLDLLPNGRAEIIAGRGAFLDSFPLLGYDPKNYDELFEEHMEPLLNLNAHEKVTWNGPKMGLGDFYLYCKRHPIWMPLWMPL